MGLFGKELANVVEWNDNRGDVLFWKWENNEIKKGSRLIVRPGQNAIFLYNGKVEGVCKDTGSFDIESKIIPFLSTLKGFKFGFNSGLRAEVLFINTKEFTEKWGTKSEINIPAEGLNLPGGLPVRAFGMFSFKIQDYEAMINKLAGIKREYTTADVKERVVAKLDQLLMKWIVKEGKDIMNLAANSDRISAGIRGDLDLEMEEIGISITDFSFQNFSYPEEVQKMVKKVASQGMIGDLDRYQRVAMIDAMANGKGAGSSASDMAQTMAGLQMGMAMANQVTQSMNGMMGTQGQTMPNQMHPGMGNGNQGLNQGMANGTQGMNQGAGNPGIEQGAANPGGSQGNGNKPNFCPNCGTKTGGGNFCSNCGTKLV